jgi:hypothetical protein
VLDPRVFLLLDDEDGKRIGQAVVELQSAHTLRQMIEQWSRTSVTTHASQFVWVAELFTQKVRWGGWGGEEGSHCRHAA